MNKRSISNRSLQVVCNSRSEASNYCVELAKRNSENFSVASWLIPRGLRRDFFHIYAFCRFSDDLADEPAEGPSALNTLQHWQTMLDEALENPSTPTHPILKATVATIQERQLNSQPFFDLLLAFIRDQHQNRYATVDDVYDYCRYSANPVGRILLDLAKVSGEDAIKRSDSICTGLQIINFCQDMSRDARNNRIYMPAEIYASHKVSEAMILERTFTGELQSALHAWVLMAYQHFADGWDLHKIVPRWLARDIQLFAGGGLAVCRKIQQQSFDVWTNRPRITKLEKLGCFVRTFATSRFPHIHFHPPRVPPQ